MMADVTSVFIWFKTANISFRGEISQETMANLHKLNYRHEVPANSVEFELSIGFIVRDLFKKLCSFYADLKIEHIGFNDNDVNLKHAFAMPLPLLLGNSLIVKAHKADDLDYLQSRYVLADNGLNLQKIADEQAVKFVYKDESYQLSLAQKSYFNQQKFIYLKLKVMVDGIIEEFYLSKSLLRYILVAAGIKNRNLDALGTVLALELLSNVLNKVSHSQLEIIDWLYCRLNLGEYSMLTLKSQRIATNIFMRKKSARLLKALGMTVNRKIHDDVPTTDESVLTNQDINLPVCIAYASLTLEEINNLHVGDIMLCQQTGELTEMFVDFGNSRIVADYHSHKILRALGNDK